MREKLLNLKKISMRKIVESFLKNDREGKQTE